MSKLVSRIRSLRASKLGRYIPGNKVLAGALAGAVTLELHTLGVTHLPFPSGAIALGAAVVVGYLLPESPVVAAHVVAKAGSVTIQTVAKTVASVKIGSAKAIAAAATQELRASAPVIDALGVRTPTGYAIPTGDGEPGQPAAVQPADLPAQAVPNAVDNGPLEVAAPTPAPGGSAQVPPAGPGA